ncbi:MAG: RimK family alpha-L-glutamate ligase [Nanoarchaeota archaeon]
MNAAVISLGSVSSQWTISEMKNYFRSVDDIYLHDVEVHFPGKKGLVLVKGKPIPHYDCIYVKGSFRYSNLLRALSDILEHKCYLPIQPTAFTVVHDKILTQIALEKHGIPTPKTYLNSTPESTRKLLETLNYPIMLKFPQGTQGKGVMFAESYAAASSLIDAFSALNQPVILQEYIETGSEDVRVIVVGEKVVAGMRRKASIKEKRANIHVGGEGREYEPTELVKKIALSTARAIGAEICGVDLLMSSARGPLVIEANISPGLQGITKATKKNVANMIAKYVHKKAEEYKKNKVSSGAKSIIAEMNVEKGHAHEIISPLDFRGTRMLLPEVVTKITHFNDHDEYIIQITKDKVLLKKY